MDDDRLGPSEVGLDDLLGGRPRGQGGRFPGAYTHPAGARWLLGRLFFAVALSAVVYGLLYFMRLVVPYPLLVTTIFVITLVKYLLGLVPARRLPRQLTGRGIRPMGVDPAEPTATESDRDGVAVAVDRWAMRLGRSGGDGSSRRTTPTWLGELVDERLRQHHGFTRASDPRRAREMMGEELWRMLSNPPAGGHTPRDMTAMVKRIEEL